MKLVPILVAALVAGTLGATVASAGGYQVACTPVDPAGVVVRCDAMCPCPGTFGGESGEDTVTATTFYVTGVFGAGVQQHHFEGNEGTSADYTTVRAFWNVMRIGAYVDSGTYSGSPTHGDGEFVRVLVNAGTVAQGRTVTVWFTDGGPLVESNVLP